MAEPAPKASEKFFITRTFTNHIAFRALESYERKSPSMFDLSKRKFKTWAEAHEYIVETRAKEVRQAKRELANAQGRLQKALQLKPPAEE